MQPGQSAPAPDVSMTDSVIGGDVSTTNIYVTQNNGVQGPFLALIIAALLLASLGVIGDAWSVEEQSTTILETTVTVESEVGLDDRSATSCVAGECTTMEYDLSDAYDNCTSLASDLEFNSSATEEMCGTAGDMASAGFTGMLFITLGILALIATLVATFMGTRGTHYHSLNTIPAWDLASF